MKRLARVRLCIMLTVLVLAGLGVFVANAVGYCGAGVCEGSNGWIGYTAGCKYGPYGEEETYYNRCCEPGEYTSQLIGAAFCEGTDPSDCEDTKVASHAAYKYTIEVNGCTATCGGSCSLLIEPIGTHVSTNVCKTDVTEAHQLVGCSTCTP